MASKILYVDDDVRFHNLVKIFLSGEEFEILCFSRGEALLEYLYANKADLVLLDLMMPGRDGWDICREIREHFSLPVIMLTALAGEADEIQGINTGADDYVVKPFSRELLIARIRGVLRRTRREEAISLEEAGILFNDLENSIEISGRTIVLRPKEFGLLKYMALNSTGILSREQLLNHVWGWDFSGDPRTLDTHIKSLRARLGEEAGRIVTVRGRGYVYRRNE